MKTTIYETITRQIVEAIEEGAGICRMPWHRRGLDITSPTNATTKRGYRGLNVISLWMIAEARGYHSGAWATYQQWRERGAQVRKGEKSATVLFWKPLQEGGANEAEAEQEEGPRARFMARAYNVFNAEQVEGLTPEPVTELSEVERIAKAESFFAHIPATVTYDGDQPCYIPSRDEVRMVPFAQFNRPTDFYAVLAHELTHWSGAKARLDRDLSGRFGSDAYAMEELVAELGAAFIVGQLGLSVPREDHAPYIANWLKVLKGDSLAIFTASSKAQAAADYLTSLAEEGGAA